MAMKKIPARGAEDRRPVVISNNVNIKNVIKPRTQRSRTPTRWPPTDDEDGECFTIVTSHKRRVRPGHGGGGHTAPNPKRAATANHEPYPRVAEQDEQHRPPPTASTVGGGVNMKTCDGDTPENSTVRTAPPPPPSPPPHAASASSGQEEPPASAAPNGATLQEGDEGRLNLTRKKSNRTSTTRGQPPCSRCGPCHHQRQTRFLPSQFDELEDSDNEVSETEGDDNGSELSYISQQRVRLPTWGHPQLPRENFQKASS
ncbi:unnamed protein product [Lampetra fluviatilis]